jgi:hypothetical protein
MSHRSPARAQLIPPTPADPTDPHHGAATKNASAARTFPRTFLLSQRQQPRTELGEKWTGAGCPFGFGSGQQPTPGRKFPDTRKERRAKARKVESGGRPSLGTRWCRRSHRRGSSVRAASLHREPDLVRLGFARRCEINSSPRGGPPECVNCGSSGEGIRCDGIALPRNLLRRGLLGRRGGGSSARQGSRSSIRSGGDGRSMTSSAEREASPACAAALGSLAANRGEVQGRSKCRRGLPHRGHVGSPTRGIGRGVQWPRTGLELLSCDLSVVLHVRSCIGGTTDHRPPPNTFWLNHLVFLAESWQGGVRGCRVTQLTGAAALPAMPSRRPSVEVWHP